jgi:hypothetical protein
LKAAQQKEKAGKSVLDGSLEFFLNRFCLFFVFFLLQLRGEIKTGDEFWNEVEVIF